MAYEVTVYRVYISTPDDSLEEKKTIEGIINDWNRVYSKHKGALLFPIYSSDTIEFIPEDYDIVLGAYWTKATKDEGYSARLMEFVNGGNPARLYFSNRDIPRAKLNLSDLNKLETFKHEFSPKGIVRDYNSQEHFVEQMENHLNRTIKDLQSMAELYKKHSESPEILEKLEEKKKNGFYNFVGCIEDTSKELVGIIGDFVGKSGELSLELEKQKDQKSQNGFASFSLETGKIFNKFNVDIEELVSSYSQTWQEFDTIFNNFVANPIFLEGEQTEDMKELIDKLASGLQGVKGNLTPFTVNSESVNSIDFNISAKIVSNKLKNFDLILDKSIERIVDYRERF